MLNSLNAGNNKTYLGESTFTTEGSKDTAAIAAKDTEVSLASAIYACAQATWTGISKDDTRIVDIRYMLMAILLRHFTTIR